MAFAVSEGSEFRAPMGQAVIGGLITSTLLTLFVVPVVYSILDDFSFRKAFGFVPRTAAALLHLKAGNKGRLPGAATEAK